MLTNQIRGGLKKSKDQNDHQVLYGDTTQMVNLFPKVDKAKRKNKVGREMQNSFSVF